MAIRSKIRTEMLSAVVLSLVVSAGSAYGQAASSQDKKFLKDLAQDSNFEIRTGKLALQKSQSADVKTYATMLIHDHTALKQQVKAADATAQLTPEGPDTMSIADHTRYDELKVLSGESFDKIYIKGLVKGNDEIVRDEKSEAANSSVPEIKKVAEHGVALDTKHAEKAKGLAAAHHIES